MEGEKGTAEGGEGARTDYRNTHILSLAEKSHFLVVMYERDPFRLWRIRKEFEAWRMEGPEKNKLAEGIRLVMALRGHGREAISGLLKELGMEGEEIRLTGRPGGGTAILERKADSTRMPLQPRSPPEPPLAAPGRVVSILVVDDDTPWREALVQRIRATGKQAYGCSEGESALIELRRKGYSAVVLDMKLPGMHGLEILQHLIKKFPGLPVILCTGYPELAELPEVKMHPYLRTCIKPVMGRQVVGLLEEVLREVSAQTAGTRDVGAEGGTA